MIYLVCFALSALFAYLAGKQQKKWLFLLFSALSILLPVLLAGLRDMSIGIDTENYYEFRQYWGKAANAKTLWAYLKYYLSVSNSSGEYFFALLVGICGQIGSFQLLLVLVHAWIMIFLYVGAWRLRKHAQPWLVLVLFYLAFFCHSLNVMRQYMALAVLFAFLPDLLKKEYLRYFVGALLATMFHNSGVLALGLLLIHWILFGDFRKLRGFAPSSRNRCICLFTVVIVFVLVLNPLSRLAIDKGLLNDKYLFYVETSEPEYNLLVTLFLLVEMVALWLLRKNLKEKNPEFPFFCILSVVYLLLYQITAFINYGKRIAAICSLPNLVTLAMLPSGLGDNITITLPKALGGKTFVLFRFLGKLSDNHKKLLGTALVIAAALVYWAYVYLLRNSSETMPYKWCF